MKTLLQIVCPAIPRRHLVRASLGALLVLPAAAQTSTTNTITGSISVPGERDVYTFSLTNRARYYFDSLTNVNTLNWSLDGPTGPVVARRAFTATDGVNANAVGVTLNPGYYQLTVDCDNSNTNSYAFRFVELTAAALVTTGTVSSNSLSPGKETDLYQFTSAAGDRLLFDRLTLDAGLSVWWRLLDPFGNEVFSATFNDVSSITQRVAGTYTLLVEGAVGNADPGFYSFSIVLHGNTPPVPFTGTPITIGSIVSGTLTNTSTNFFTFSLATNKVLVFDNLTNSPGTTAFVEGPPGLVVNGTGLNNTDGQNGAPLLELAPGEYQVRIQRTTAGTQFYRFRLLDTELATTITPGVAIQDSLSPSSETKLYRFDATAGTRFFFETESTNGPPSAEWRLFNPYGERVTQAGVRTDRGPLTLPISGAYTLLIEGWYGDDPGNTGYRFNVVPVSDGVQALTLGALTTGSISTPGGMQQYLFTLATPTMLYFDSRTNNTSSLRWSLDGPTGNVVNSRAFTSSDANAGFGVLDLPAGDYTINVTAISDNTGGFGFRLFDLAGAPVITPGIPVSSTLNPANETDAYRFTASPGAEMFFDAVSVSGLPNSYWRCVDPFGNSLFGNFLVSTDPGRIRLDTGGTYTLLVEGYHSETGSGAYTVNVVPVSDNTQPLTLGSVATGNLATPGQKQIYNFVLPAAALVYFDSRTGNSTLRWSLDGPTGNLVNNRAFTSSDGSTYGVLNLPGGGYTLTVSATTDNTGGYSFRLFDLATAPPITLGGSITNTLDPANETDAYRFTAATGTEVYFDLLDSSSLPNARWRCVDQNGTSVMSGYIGDDGPLILSNGGIYTLLVEGYHSEVGSGNYAFRILPVVDGLQALTLGNVVSGAINSPGQEQRYLFSLASPAVLYFDSLTGNSQMRWWLAGPSGDVVNNRAFTSSDGAGITDPLLELTPGEYTLTVSATTDNVGNYQFRLFEIATATVLTPGVTVGATLNPANETDAYRFTVNAGDRFFFDWISDTGIPTVHWRVFDPFGSRVFGFYATDGGTNVLAATGTYTLFVEGYHSDTGSGSYQFNVVPTGNVPPVPFTGTPLTLGATINGNLPTAATTNDYTFNLASPAQLLFDSLVNADFNWTLRGPPGTLVANRSFQASDSVHWSSALLQLPSGDYQLSVQGLAGDYSFRLLDLASGALFTPGNVVTGLVAQTKFTVLHRFSALAGERFFFDGRPVTGYSTPPYVRLLAPFGDQLLLQQITSDEDTFVVPADGDYTVSVEGRYADTGTNGTYSFLLQPVTDATNSFAVGQTVNGNLALPGQQQYHAFTLAAPALLFFDSLVNNGLTWTLSGRNGDIVSARRFDNSDAVDGIARLDLPADDYVIKVDGTLAATGSYSFRLLDSSSAVAFTPGTNVNGSLTPGISTKLYRFNATAGQRLYFDGQPVSGFTSTPYARLYAPLGNQLFLRTVSSDEDVFELAQTGSYLLAVEGRFNDTSTNGNFSFLLQPVVDGTNALTVGNTVSGNISWPGQHQFHPFTLPVPARLFFDSLVNSALRWTLTGPSGVVVNDRTFNASDSIDGNSQLDLPAGGYVISVSANGAATGSYSFRLLDATTAVPFPPGTIFNGALAPGISSTLLRFSANAGDKFYFDGLPVSGFTSTPYVRLVSPLGNLVIPLQQVTLDEPTFAVPQAGSYVMAVEGRFNDTSTNGNYSFLLVPNPVQPQLPLFDTNIAPDLNVTGVAVNPPAGLQSGDSATVSWTTRNDGNAATAGVFTERVTVRNTGTSQIIVNRTLVYDEALSGAILPGGTRSRALAITLPDGPTSVGTLEVTVTTDALNNIFEQNGGGTGEANNASSININTTLAPYPDLQVTGLTATPPSAWFTGSVVSVSWTITNTGTRATSGSWVESLLVRNTNTSQIIVNTTTNYDVTEPGNGDIDPAGSRSRELSFVMPMNSSAYGAFEVIVTTDSEDGLFEYVGSGVAETNNSASLISASAPDLIVTGLNVTGDPLLQAGADLVIQWNVENQGNVPTVGSFYDRIMVRNTNTAELLLNTLLPYNPNQVGNGPIAPAGARARQYVYHLPNGAPAVGQLAVTVTADGFNQIVEHNPGGTAESNNTAQAEAAVAGTPYPDLIVTSISGPTSGLPGQIVPLVWTIQNVGTVPATGSWSDQLFLSADAVIGSDQYLASVFFNGTLNPGATLTRTQMVTLPSFGAGDFLPVAKTDAGSQVFEESEANNSAIASTLLIIPAALTLTLSPQTVVENGGSQASLATLSRNIATAQPLFVTLSSSQLGRVSVPASVTIPGGGNATSFYVSVVDDTLAGTNFTALITAQATNHTSGSNTLTVIENDPLALTLTLSAASVLENAAAGTVTGTVTRNANLGQALTVTLSSDRPTALTVPVNVVIPIGSTNAQFNLTPVDDSLPTGTRVAAIYASATGFGTVSRSISVLDDDSVSITLKLSETNVTESVVNPASLATITRTPVSTEQLRVRLSTNGGSGIQIPAEVYIPANQPAVQFNVNVVDDLLAFGSRTVNIIAEGQAVTGLPIPGASSSASITIQDDDGPTLFVTIPVGVISENGSTTATIMRNTPPTNSLTATLAAAPGGQATLPNSVTFAVGDLSTNVTINGVVDGVSDGAQEIIITASTAGYNPGTALLTVSDIDVPDLAVALLSGPTNAITDAQATVVWSGTNLGLATATGPWVDEVYLATDSQGANLISLVAVVTNSASVVVGDSYSFSRSFTVPADPGTYWFVLHTDTRGDVMEGSEHNNKAVAGPLVVQPAYRATVSTTVDSAASGTPIPLTGYTYFTGTGSNAPFRTATIRINKGSFRRTISIISDANGEFSTVFQPIPGEAGVYQIGADHPRVRQDPVQDQFTLLGMSAVPWNLTVRLAPNIPLLGQIEVRNLSPLPLSGISVGTEGLPLGFNVNTTFTNGLAGDATEVLMYDITSSLTTPFQGVFNLLISSVEGAELRIPVNFTLAPPTAQLAAQPSSLTRDMLRGSQTLISLELLNQGGSASGDLTVALPPAPWLSLVSTSTIASLAPGDRATVVFALTPATNLPLTLYSGNVAFVGAQVGLSVPFNFRAVSDARGDLRFTVTDELTYYAAGAPNVTNATITLRDPITSSVITNGNSDANGEVLFLDLPEGNYLIEASAPRHALVRGGIRVVPGVTTEQEVFMTRESVRYEWTVVPTLIEDHYRVTLQPLFETEVPQPQLVVENPVIAPLVIPGQTSQFEIRLRNNGLIALQRVRVPTPSHPKLEITPLVNEIETLPAQTTISVPVTIRLRPAAPGGDAPSAGGGGGPGGGGACEGTECVIHMPIDTRYRCGENFVPMQADVELQVVCVPDTGCEFERVDVTHVDFFNVNQLLDRAELDCLMGKLDECQKARIRGYARSGDLGSVDGPFGFGISDFCGCGPSAKIPALFNVACAYLEALGFQSPTGCGGATLPLNPPPVNFGSFHFWAATIPGPCNPSAPATGNAGGGPVPPYPYGNGGGGIGGDTPPVSNAGGTGVCARVRIEIGQDVTMTRSAFRGTLVIDNDGSALTGIQISLDFRDAANQSVASLFAVSGPTLSGLTAVDGTGIIAAQSTGSAEYLFIPTLNAALSGPTPYYLGGTLRFIEDGVEVIVPLLPAPITVFPEARLQLDYFLQRDVFSDDPFTPEREPAEPFALGLLVRNTGAGAAHNLQIQSGQPRIVDNEKGLLIEFALLGVRVGGAPFTPSFNVNFGDINPAQSALAIWELTASLQGKFIEFTGSFEHLDALGGFNLSLIENLNVHEMIHVVRADRPGDDLLSDFLVNDVPDPDNLPDVVYLSDGSTGAVSLATSPMVDSPPTTNDLQIQLTVTMPAGWTYLRMTNPGPQFELVGVLRSDARQLALGENVWTTDRSFPSSQAGVVREDLLHLFDHDSTGSYTLTFAVISDDTNAPVSAVAALPATSTATFAVLWDGDDGTNGSGIAYFDIYTSVNGGPFTNWLAQTTLGSAIFTGTPGETYAFHSVATDNAGNVELAPAMADAQTTAATGANTDPTISPIADVTIDEGVKFTLSPTVIDSDVPAQTLSYSLPAAPVGAVIEPTSGFIQWQTGEAQGGSTNLFILVVSDNGLPSLSSTQSFHVIVREVNNAPFFVSPLAEVEVDEGTMLAYTAAASDADVPPNQLSWSLGAGAPSGMTLNAANGLLNWMPAEADGPGEFPVTITVTDNGSPTQSVSRILRVLVREANQPPELAAIPTQGTLVQTTLYVTNSATDPDLPAQEFYFSLAPGAPKGASIRPDTGVFSWTPSSAYALSTNQVTVQVTDNGLPSLTASRTFTIVVGDYLEARLGRVVAPSGGSNSVTVAVFTTVPVTNVAFIFEPMLDRLSNFNLSAAAPPLASATLSPLGGNQYQVQLVALPGQTMSGEQAVMDLRFDAPAGQPSAFVPLVVSGVVATQVDGQPVPKAAGSPGRVVYLDQESLLELVPQSNHMDLVLYGRAPEYVIQSTPGLPPLGAWTRLRDGSPTNYVLSFPVITTNHMGFFRAVEGGPFRFSAIEVNPLNGEVTLNLSVLAGLTYELQWTTNAALWNSFFTNTATSNVLIVTDQPATPNDRRLYRAIER